ncbi:hypothetical protein PG984_016204 [Apiospora sp. TS-2023a]
MPSPLSGYESERVVPMTALGDELVPVTTSKPSCFSSSEFVALHPAVGLAAVVGDAEASDDNSPCDTLESIHTGSSETSDDGCNSKTAILGKTDLPPADLEVRLFWCTRASGIAPYQRGPILELF